MITERHIFQGEVNLLFSEKLHDFHDSFVETMLLCGVDKPGTALNKIKMTKNPKYNLDYYKKIVGGLMKFSPNIYSCCINEDGELVAEMCFTYLNDEKYVDGIFLLQNVYYWENSDLFCAQVWQLRDIDLFNINNFWLD